MSYWKNKGEIKAKFSVHLIVQKDSAKRIASSDSEFRAFSVGFSSALLVDFEVHALMFVLVPRVFSRHRSTHFCWMWFLQKWKMIFYTSQCLLYLVWRKLSNFAQCKFLEYFPKYRDLQFSINLLILWLLTAVTTMSLIVHMFWHPFTCKTCHSN